MQWMIRPDYGLIGVTGKDTRDFLQGQFTNNIQALAPDRVVRTAYCTPQGRALALITVLPHAHGALMVLPKALVEPIAKRLQMYILRSRVSLQILDCADRLFCSNELPNQAMQRDQAVSDQYGLAWVASVEPALSWRLAPAPGQTSQAQPFDVNLARLWQIRAGLPELDESSTGQYVPQMLNLDALDAISFNKGCYTGQEIVARTQHLGRIKRRVFRLTGEGVCPRPGCTLSTNGQSAGKLLMCARANSGFTALAVLQLEAVLAGNTLQADGVDLELRSLPYTLPGNDGP